MKKSQTELTYLRSAAQNATAAGLVIILYDLLVNDLEQAIAALAERDVERRTAEINHAFLVLQQLEGSLDMENGGDAAQVFSRFYSTLRSKIFEAHLKASPELLKRQIALVFDVRQAWQQVDKPNLGPAYASAESIPPSPATDRARAASASGGNVTSMNWTA
jgi:flagellar secretion chaperone FliS